MTALEPPDDGQPPARHALPGAWSSALAAELDVAPLTTATVGALLRLSRDVAHATERVNAPLTAYVAGLYVAARVAAGGDEAAALSELEAVVRRRLAATPARPPA